MIVRHLTSAKRGRRSQIFFTRRDIYGGLLCGPRQNILQIGKNVLASVNDSPELLTCDESVKGVATKLGCPHTPIRFGRQPMDSPASLTAELSGRNARMLWTREFRCLPNRGIHIRAQVYPCRESVLFLDGSPRSRTLCPCPAVIRNKGPSDVCKVSSSR